MFGHSRLLAHDFRNNIDITDVDKTFVFVKYQNAEVSLKIMSKFNSKFRNIAEACMCHTFLVYVFIPRSAYQQPACEIPNGL